ncbi:coiled-coil domain-containing protein 60-like [Octopus sinensis]|uniref:Coiled-coil domain-containing protein 60-like n=1 Tax=Octopus sinensis TaxID=2607531 RepID=A0A6P7S7D7_9MOLL|nr:coiled-coil domain-containing protein 60-like [Octopus sinensis]XP_036357497.1 coiled-coil domain-containing protein 60-like [Octopus sinensis]
MPVASGDPRNYVKCIPIPTANHKGVKIQARSSTIYNATIPTRDEIRKANYTRRQQQLSSQGFYCPVHLPYKEIGEPIYLDEETLILHAVGQLQEDVNKKNTNQTDNEKKDNKQQLQYERPPSRSYAVTKMINLRSKKQLNTLNKAISNGRVLVRNVSLGRDLFVMIKETEHKKKKAVEDEERKRKEKVRLQWRNPMSDSSDESGIESDNESNDSQNDLDGTKSIVSESSSSMNNSSSDKKPTITEYPSNRKKSIHARPYTPQHNNIAHCVSNINGDSLFRQLCALHWLLEASSNDSNHSMNHIHSSWNIEDIGGSKIFLKKFQKQRLDYFNTSGIIGNACYKLASGRKQYGYMTRRSSSRRSSYTTGLSVSTTPIHQSQEVASPSYRTESSLTEDCLEMLNEDNSSVSSLLPESELTIGNLTGQDNTEDNVKLKSTTETFSSNENSKLKLLDEMERKKSRLNSKFDESSPKVNFVARHQIRPKSSSEVKSRHHQENLIQLLRQKFEDVKEDKAFSLHDTLEKIEKENLLVCQSKYRAISADHFSYRHVLNEMRRKTVSQFNKFDEKIVPDNNWFVELQEKIPSALKSLWYYKAILHKLSKFSFVKFGERLSAYKFLKVLSTLEPWDICSPDISAAIEFCRAKITDITIEEYEIWFRQQFPAIYRPETAPASTRKSNSHHAFSRTLTLKT